MSGSLDSKAFFEKQAGRRPRGEEKTAIRETYGPSIVG